jgi:nucleolar GTP-binding protein
MTEKMTAAGIDPSRIQERAEILAKARAAERKRKRGDEDVEMDDEGDSDDDEGDQMDVDDTPRKRVKDNKGAIVTVGNRAPRGDRTQIGMRNKEVSQVCNRKIHNF